jgi:hypothetical protein
VSKRKFHFPLPKIEHQFFSYSARNLVTTTASDVQWSEFLATDPEVRVRFQELPNFMRSMGLEWGPLSLVSTVEEYLEEK